MSGGTGAAIVTGQRLPEVVREISQQRVDAYASAAKDFNPIHLDREFAAGTQFGRPIAHGMLSLALIGEVMALAFPDTWHKGGRVKVRFKAPVFNGDTVTVAGEVTAISAGQAGPVAACRVALVSQRGEEAVSGQVWVPVGGRQPEER